VQQRLSGWKAKVISYAGRFELIKSTLSSFHLFWVTVFLLSQSVLHALDRQIRDFFWNCWSSSYLHPIAWSTICQPVAMGGLGVRSIMGVAKAALIREIWNVILNRTTCWNIWVNVRYLKGDSFWDVASPKSASWGWKGILALQPLALPHIKFLLGNGHTTHFWTNPWLPGRRLRDCFGSRTMYDLGLGKDLRVSTFIVHGGWHLPPPTSATLMDIFHLIPIECQPWPEFGDEIVWTLEEEGFFSLKSAYKLVCSIPNQQLSWTSAIWFKGAIKKHSICAWMFFRGRLKTKDFLLQRNVDCDTCCVLCDCTWETSLHLMLHCPYAQAIWGVLLSKLNLFPISCSIAQELLDSMVSRSDQNRNDSLILAKLLFNAYVWHVWAERNARIFRKVTLPYVSVVQRIIQMVTTKILYLELILPNDIQCHWIVPVHTPVMVANLVTERPSGWRLLHCL